MTEDFVAGLGALANEEDPARRDRLVRALPDRGTGPLPGTNGAMWGTKDFRAAVPGLDEGAAKQLLRLLFERSPHPRTQALAAWALRDFDDAGIVANAVHLWRELVVLAFASQGLGAIRGFAADAPDGIRESWPTDEVNLDAIEDLVGARLGDLEKDPLGLIPRQMPICDVVPSYDCGRRIADVVARILSERWPSAYPARDEPVREDQEWERLRTTFLESWKTRRAEREAR